MRNFLFLFLFLTFLPLSQAQETNNKKADIKEIFLSSKVGLTFLGIDFSLAKMVGSEGFSDPEAIQSQYFGKWNYLLLDENEKYDLKGAFRKRNIDYDIDVVTENNDNVEYIDMVTNKTPKSLTDEEIQKTVKKYKIDSDNALGLVFMVHSFNKLQEQAIVHVLVINNKSRKVLFNEKISGKPGGFGMRNYWGRSFYNILNDIKKTYFEKWKKDIID